MKRNKAQSSRAMRQRGSKVDNHGRSPYANKVKAGKQMYGGKGSDSCCAHRVKLG